MLTTKGILSFRKLLIYLIVFFSCISFVFTQNKITLPPELDENSGVIAINDTLYWINDGGNPSNIWATDLRGTLINKITLPTPNVDWEAFTQDALGNKYIADVGNNTHVVRPLHIYKLNKHWEHTETISFQYPHVNDIPVTHDVEAVSWYHNRLHLFTKSNDLIAPPMCYHYSLDLRQDVLEATHLEHISLGKYLPTDATTSPDGKKVLLLAYRYKFIFGLIPDSDVAIFIFNIDPTNGLIFNSPYQRIILPTWFAARPYESIAFIDQNTVIIGAEKVGKLKPIMKKVNVSKYIND